MFQGVFVSGFCFYVPPVSNMSWAECSFGCFRFWGGRALVLGGQCADFFAAARHSAARRSPAQRSRTSASSVKAPGPCFIYFGQLEATTRGHTQKTTTKHKPVF
jgi:hypothetical protein